MKINDALSGMLLALFAVVIYLYAATLPQMGQQIGAAVFPQLLAGGFLICAIFLVRQGLRSVRAEGWFSWPEWFRERRAVAGFLLVLLALVFYVLASEKLGFLPTAFILLMGLFMVFRVSFKLAVPVALLSALGIHYLFYKFLKVPLPWGILQPVAW